MGVLRLSLRTDSEPTGTRRQGAQRGVYFVSAREHGRRLSAPPPDPGEVARHLEPVVEMAARRAVFPI